MIRQVLAVTWLGARSFRERFRSSLMIIVALVSVTVPPLVIFALGSSLKASYLATGSADRVMIVSQEALLQTSSQLSSSWSRQIAAAPGIRQWHGQALMDMEISAGLHRPKRTRPEKGYTKVRGFGPLGFVMRPELKLVAGRLPKPGSHEVIVGFQAWRKFTGLEIGREVEIAKTNWRVVGIFRGGGNLDGDLIADAGLLKAALHRETYDIALLALTSQDDLPRIKEALHSLPVTVLREQDYYARMWRSVPNNALYVAVVLLVIIGGGALAATTHGVYAAVESRAREIVILRAIGFDSVAISAALILETVLVAGLGACIGTGIVGLWVGGYPYNGGMEGGVFRVTMTWGLLLIALSWAFVVALAGAMMPCVKAGRGTVADAMRAL